MSGRDNPKDLRSILETLSSDDLETLSRRLATVEESSGPDKGVSSDTRAAVGVPADWFPATSAQILFWRRHQADPDDAQDHQSLSFLLEGTFDAERLKSAFRDLSEVQTSLVTLFVEDERDVWQRVVPGIDMPFEVTESAGGPNGESNDAAETEEFTRRPFDLERQPPIRVRLVRKGAERHELHIVMHHIAFDGKSKRLLLKELSQCYNALASGASPAARPVLSGVCRWALRERIWLAGDEARAAVGYWMGRPFRKGLGHPWPLNRESTSSVGLQGMRSVVSEFSFDFGLSERIRVFSAQRGMTPFQLLTGCYFLCLMRLFPDDAITVGMPVDIRRSEEEDSLLGCLMNIVPLTMEPDAPASIEGFLRLAGHRIREAIEFARLPLCKILELEEEAGPGIGQVKWRTIVNFKSHHTGALCLDGATASDLRAPSIGMAADLVLTFRGDEDGGGRSPIHLSVDFDPSSLSSADLSLLLQTWKSVVCQCVEEGKERVSDIDVLLPGERERILELSGKGDIVDYPGTTLHAIFKETALRYPDRPAVIEADGRETSYADLQSQVSKVSSYLRAGGLERESVVAVHMQRSAALLAALLGVSEAGGAFLLLEPSLPTDRLRAMMEQARVAAVVTGEGMDVVPGFMASTHRFEDILTSDVSGDLGPGEFEAPDSLAYVMFTSGSTGVPKGAMVEHRNIVNRLSYTREAMGFGLEDRTLLKSPLSFDVCLTELLMPMFTGAAVVMADRGEQVDVQRIADLVALRRATYLHFVPGMLNAFLRVPDVPKVNGILRMIRCGGESLPDHLMEQCLGTLQAKLFQSYGPAETAVAVTLWECHSDHGHSRPPIGRPNANVDILIMGPQGRPVPPGMAGELWIGGAQTGRGYIHNEEETRARFVADPLEPGSGRRYYKSGDIARFLPDGNLLFLGRMDEQLKVRGVRIELGDVTAALLRCHGVREAVVLAEPDGEGSNRLRAWVTVQDDSIVNEPSIRSSMSGLLPGYMAPFRIHVIDSIPLTPHGKTDHRALKTIAEMADDGTEVLPLETSTERRLASLWSELLAVEVQSRDADFFRLGGHSLIAMRMAGRIKKDFGLTVSLSDFYRDGRLEGLAALVDAGGVKGGAVLCQSDRPAAFPGEPVPMSWSQRRMWMLQELLPTPSSYHIAHVFQIPGERSALEAKSILQAIAGRHGILRTRLMQDDGGFWQAELSIDEWRMDWAELEAGSEEECIGLLSQARELSFNLSNDCGWRARWIARPEGAALLLLVFHHALTDEWSMNLFRREFGLLLSGAASAESLPRPAHSYADFSRWQHWELSHGLREILEAYWRDRLSGIGETARLIPDRSVPESRPGGSGKVSLDLGTIRSMMETYCRREGVSRYAVWMSVWQVLMWRLCGGEEVVLITPVSERVGSEWQDVMGMFLNTLPIRARVDGRSSFRAFSGDRHRSLAEDMAHGKLPYEDILRVSGIVAGADGQHLAQTMFVLHGEQEWSETDTSVSDMSPKPRYVKNPLTLHITDRTDSCRATLVYDKDRFLEVTSEDILRRFESVARQVLSSPDVRVSDIDLLLPGERERIQELSGKGDIVDYPGTTLHGIFRETALSYPDRPAVIEANGRERSYADLQSQVSKVSSYLRAGGLKRESVVAVHMHRSAALLAALLGVSEAGGAFLLLDPNLPTDRLRAMMEQARVAAVVTGEGMDVVPGFMACTHRIEDILTFDVSGDMGPGQFESPESLAYVMFTSGSTGLPKGVMVEHRSIMNRLFSVKDLLMFGPDDRSLFKSPLSFDVSLGEALLPLVSGGAVVLPFEDGIVEPLQLIEWVRRHRVSYLHFVPSALRSYLGSGLPTAMGDSLRFLWCGGEPLDEDLRDRLLEGCSARLIHGYGPTEAAIGVTVYECRTGDHSGPPPIGRPNANVDILIMDSQGRPVPPGMAGEIWIGGAQTARGYIHNEEETKARFVGDPLESGSGRRYYRTGDLARFLPDGNLLFLGRVDEQLKVRGVRIELGDVTASLLRCEGVCEAVVLGEPDGEGSNRLRAWVTLKRGFVGGESEIRSSLSVLLPGYMLPFRIHVVDSMPLTGHGKRDHRALRELAVEQDAKENKTRSLTETERCIAEVWSDCLKTELHHPSDDFFRLGGHSLLALRMLSKVREQFAVETGLSDLYANSSLGRFSSRVDALVRTSVKSKPIPAAEGSLHPLSPGQRRIWMLRQMLGVQPLFRVTTLLALPSSDLERARRVLQHIQDRHAILRTRIVQEEGNFYQEVESFSSCELPWSIRSVSEAGLSECLSGIRAAEDTFKDGRLWRVFAFRTEERCLLYLVFDHVSTDAWSMGILHEEFLRWMETDMDSGTKDQRQPPWSYADFTHWHLRILDEGLRASQSEFWSRELNDLSGMMRLTPDKQLPQGIPGRSGSVSFTLPAHDSQALAELSGREGGSLFSLLLCAFDVLLHRWTGECDIVVGIPVSLRRRVEWEGVMGYFLNTLPVRMSVTGRESFLSLYRGMRQRLEGVLAHSDLPFSEIAAKAGGLDGMPFHAFLQAMFTVVGLPGHESLASDPVDHPWAKEGYATDDLCCTVDVGREEWRFLVGYDADRFDGWRMQSLADTFRFLILAIARTPETPICSIPLMGPEPLGRMLEKGSGTLFPLPEDPSIHGMFSLRCLHHPDVVAIEERDLTMTYGELEGRSDRLAAHLVEVHGIVAEDVVGLLLPMGALQVTCLLAVWKTGASVVPIDPTLPGARIRHMLDESGATALMKNPAADAHAFEGIRTIDATYIASDTHRPPSERATAHGQRAYCMFTSGSTGSPKGVFNTHAGFVNMAVSLSKRAGIEAVDRVLQYSAPTFDVSLFEVFMAFFNGARLVVAGRTEVPDLPVFIRERKVTVAMLTPLVIGMMDTEDLCRLRVLFTGGEEARPVDMARLSGRVRVFNIYGPTECSVWSTLFELPTVWDPSRKVPVGRPLDNVTVRILDPYGHPVPPGMDGEIHIAGAGVGLGYMGGRNSASSGFEEDATSECGRVYRTGDLGRWTMEGDILFCGRRDAQVKVMGVRIEIEEIRAAVESLPGVESAFVMVRKRGASEPVMIAFAVMRDGMKPEVAAMRDRLSDVLPSYMLPTRIHGIERLPKTRHGKTDRARLEELDEAFLVAQESRSEIPAIELPVGPYETDLASIWCSLLSVTTVGREDGFFDLGGDSIGLIRLMEAVRSRWKVAMEVSRIYSHISLRRMADLIRDLCQTSVDPGEQAGHSGLVTVWDSPGGRNVFVMVGGAGIPEEYTKYHRIGQWLGTGYRLLVLPDPEVLAGRLPRRRLGDLVAEYESMIRKEQPKGPYRLMGDCLGGIDAYGVACSLQRSGAEVESLVLLDTVAPMAPVVRSMVGEGLSAYASLPETRHPMKRAWFRIRMSVTVMMRGWWHPVPGSRSEVFEQAMEYGLFDPSVHARECPVFEGDPEERFSHYIGQGHLQRITPSDTFNPYRYKKNVPVFDIRTDNPVLHALLIGMRSRFIAGKVFRYAGTDNRRSDLMAARSFIRRELFHPGTFHGDIDVVMSSRIHERRPTGGWERYVDGNVRTHLAEGDHRSYLAALLAKTAAIIKDILVGVSGQGTSRGDAQDRRGLRSGGLQ